MAPVAPKNTIQHFTHPTHPLQQVCINKEYKCDGCKTNGIGKRYRCNSCDFDLHEHCAMYPATLSTFMHPQHQLSLVLRKAQSTRLNERLCNVCGDNIEGLFYRCKPCDFDVHPLCIQLPQYVRHTLHRQDHPPLQLEPSPAWNTWCLVCKSACSSWRYRCGICFIDVHLQCILAPCDEPSLSSSSRSVPPQHQRPPPPGHPPAYGAYPCGGQPPPCYPPAYGASAYGAPFTTNPYDYMYQYQNSFYNSFYNVNLPAQVGGGGGVTNGWKANSKMFVLVGKLVLGVLGNTVFGIPDVSSFL